MYELVNTSVPNGLIAGTHGFSTVAMTKGMPEAIRTRVENFCAYPHRTSAHDATYFAENPVNWFHLTLPNGDHVLGRTAPADFDYTGRTNRLSRTLVFGSREMPGAGGASVLSAAAQMLSEPWTGDPKYLADNKALAGQLRFLDRSKTPSPSNWIALFGANGDDLARRFAALVAKNVSAGGRSVYFKLSTAADATGMRVLGLFADLIDLLPDDVAPFVTFSTFSPCVPSGVTCHLRGVFDSDRAFDVASATQPWVDCEHGRIVHAELLPEPLAVASDKPSPAIKSIDEPAALCRDTARISPLERSRRSAAVVGAVSRLPGRATSNEDRFLIKMMVGFAAAVVLMVGGAVWYVHSSHEATSIDQILNDLNTSVKEDVASSSNMRQLAEPDAAEREIQERQTNLPLAKAVSTDTVDEEDTSKQHAAAKETADRLEAEIKQDRNREEEEAKRKEEQQKAEAEKRAIIERLLQDLPKATVLTDGLTADQSVEECIAALPLPLRLSLTNEQSIVAYYLKDRRVEKAFCRFERTERKLPGGRVKADYRLVKDPGLAQQMDVEAGVDRTPWVIWRIVNPDVNKERIYWKWLEQSRDLKLMKDKPDLAAIFFGDDPGPIELWKKSVGSLVFCIKRRGDDDYRCYADAKTDVAGEFQGLKSLYETDIQDLENKQADVKRKSRNCEDNITKAAENIKNAWDEYNRWQGMPEKDRKKKFGTTTEEEKICATIERLLNDNYDLVGKNKGIQLTSMTYARNKIKEAGRDTTRCPHPGGHALGDIPRKLERKRKELKVFDRIIAESDYNVEIVTRLDEVKKMGLNKVAK